jgi:hypothetical protein
MMKRIVGLVAVVCLALAGCSPGGETTPSETPLPTLATPTTAPPVTPTPQWTEEEQSAIDAVQAYLDVWTDIAQHLPDTDIGRINTVASGDLATEDVDDLMGLQVQGQRLEGSAVFTPDRVQKGPGDGEGQRYYVHGCFDATDARWVYVDGTPVYDEPSTAGPTQFTVLHTTFGVYGVVDDQPEEGSC